MDEETKDGNEQKQEQPNVAEEPVTETAEQMPNVVPSIDPYSEVKAELQALRETVSDLRKMTSLFVESGAVIRENDPKPEGVYPVTPSAFEYKDFNELDLR